ncbi:hypothetical protein GGR56DRAFT_681011 [Xylariaceae sp. FL0804]|nr:hypothetical protein GGR56DRAFT_681011 [Xylariaceae sp. FL0804]
MGIEFEFALASRRLIDVHPAARGNKAQGNKAPWIYSCSKKIITELRKRGVEANHVKIPEAGPPNKQHAGQKFFSIEDGLPDADPTLDSWNIAYTPSAAPGDRTRVEAHKQAIWTEWEQFTRGLGRDWEFRKTPLAALERCRAKISDTMEERGLERARAVDVAMRWHGMAQRRLWNAAQKHGEADNDRTDPIAVRMPGVEGNDYQYWQCVSDTSVGVDKHREDADVAGRWYLIPADSDSVPLRPPGAPKGGEAFAQPPRLYRWFGAEVISPILDYNHAETWPRVQQVCAALRNALRIHKPADLMGSGLHLHFGQERGFSLRQLKRFTALWLLLEDTLYGLHRRDRSDAFYCDRLRKATRVGVGESPRTARSPRRRQLVQFEAHVATEKLMEAVTREAVTQELFDAVQAVWLCRTVDELREFMAVPEDIDVGQQPGVKYRVSGVGNRTSDPRYKSRIHQTLEIRIMQGTLDAEHVQHWAAICERLVHFSRVATVEAYREAVRQIIEGHELSGLGWSAGDLDWFQRRKNVMDNFFHYPLDVEGKDEIRIERMTFWMNQ